MYWGRYGNSLSRGEKELKKEETLQKLCYIYLCYLFYFYVTADKGEIFDNFLKVW